MASRRTDRQVKFHLDQLGTIRMDTYVLGKIHALEWVLGLEEKGYKRRKITKVPRRACGHETLFKMTFEGGECRYAPAECPCTVPKRRRS